MLPALLLAQAVAGPVLPASPQPRAHIPCPPATDTTDVVVCAANPDRFRLKPLAPRPDPQALRPAELHLGSAVLAAEAEQATLTAGQQSRRLMMRLKLPLGRARRP